MTRRTTLRPVETPVVSLQSAPPPTPIKLPQRSTSPYIIGGLLAIGLLTLGTLTFVATRPTTTAVAFTPEAAPAAALVSPPVVGTAAPACPSIASFLDVIGSYERQAKWGLAASTAQTALRTPSLCEADRAALAQKLVALSREALFEQPPAREDAPGQRRVLTAYTDLKTLATQYGVQTPAPLPIAQSAYDNRLFLLATVAYADAFANGDTSADDRAVVRADYAAFYNLGLSWAQRADASQRQDGLARLATACRINDLHQLGSPDACNALQTLVGPPTRWPAPVMDPLINAPGSVH